MSTEIKLKGYDYTNELYKDVAVDPVTKALLVKDLTLFGVTKWTFPPTRNMGGVLSLSDIPTISQYEYCGFTFFTPYASSGVVELLENSGVNAIISTSGSSGEWGGYTVEEWSEMSGVKAFFLGDDTPYGTDEQVQAAKDAYDAIKARTDRPVGSIFYMFWDAPSRVKLIDLCNYLDFGMIQCYPYREGHSEEEIDADIQEMIDLAGDITSPIFVLAQGGNDEAGNHIDPGEAGIRHQYERYYNAGLCICWYAWNFGAHPTDIEKTYQSLMNEFYRFYFIHAKYTNAEAVAAAKAESPFVHAGAISHTGATLKIGTQTEGRATLHFYAGAGDYNYAETLFREKMSNTPSSITLSNAAETEESNLFTAYPKAYKITLFGFVFYIRRLNPDTVFYSLSKKYLTVGN